MTAHATHLRTAQAAPGEIRMEITLRNGAHIAFLLPVDVALEGLAHLYSTLSERSEFQAMLAKQAIAQKEGI